MYGSGERKQTSKDEGEDGDHWVGLGGPVRCRRSDPGLPDDWVALQQEQRSRRIITAPGARGGGRTERGNAVGIKGILGSDRAVQASWFTSSPDDASIPDWGAQSQHSRRIQTGALTKLPQEEIAGSSKPNRSWSWSTRQQPWEDEQGSGCRRRTLQSTPSRSSHDVPHWWAHAQRHFRNQRFLIGGHG